MVETRRNAPTGDQANELGETEQQRERRLAYEAGRIEAAKTSIEAGQGVPFRLVREWIDSIGTPAEKAPPIAR